MTDEKSVREKEAERLARARGRLTDRGIDPDVVLGRSGADQPISVVGLYGLLTVGGASEKAGQSPTFALARLALKSGLPSEVADTLFLAYNQQSAEEAGHGDKVFGNAYYAMGGRALNAAGSVFDDNASSVLVPGADPAENRARLEQVAGALGGIETAALQGVFPFLLGLLEQWNHRVSDHLRRQIHETVRPEESRHVLIWRYVFHSLVAPADAAATSAYFDATNGGRESLGLPALPHAEIARMLGSVAPTARQLLGKDGTAVV
jgi:hypothetical protein